MNCYFQLFFMFRLKKLAIHCLHVYDNIFQKTYWNSDKFELSLRLKKIRAHHITPNGLPFFLFSRELKKSFFKNQIWRAWRGLARESVYFHRHQSIMKTKAFQRDSLSLSHHGAFDCVCLIRMNFSRWCYKRGKESAFPSTPDSLSFLRVLRKPGGICWRRCAAASREFVAMYFSERAEQEKKQQHKCV